MLTETIVSNRFIPFPPHPKQVLFLTAPVKERMYGGAAGGGKSAALLMLAVQYAHVPGHAALLLRRTFADLKKPGALIDLSHQWFGPTDAEWNGNEMTWYFPCGEKRWSTLTFGYLKNEADVFQYQSSAFHTIGFDELTHFSEKQYRYMFSRCRRPKNGPASGVPLRVGSATNPGGVGHLWVRQRFIRGGARPGRLFVPARLEENPGLDVEGYRQNLALLDAMTRAQLERGDWDIRPEGNLFKYQWFATRIRHRSAVPKLVSKVRYWDLAATEKIEGEESSDPDWSVGLKLGRDVYGQFWIMDVKRVRQSPMGVEKLVQQCAKADGKDCPVVIEQEPGASGKTVISTYRRRVLRGYEVRGNRVSGSKEVRAKPASAAVEQGDVMLVDGPWIEDFLDEACAFPVVSHDDQVDAFTGAYEFLADAAELDDADEDGMAEAWGESLTDANDVSAGARELERVRGTEDDGYRARNRLGRIDELEEMKDDEEGEWGELEEE